MLLLLPQSPQTGKSLWPLVPCKLTCLLWAISLVWNAACWEALGDSHVCTRGFLSDAVACKLIKEARGGHDVIYALFAVSPALL